MIAIFLKSTRDKNGLLGEGTTLVIIGRSTPLQYLAEADTAWLANRYDEM